MIVKPLTAESTLTVSTNVSLASVVRLYNADNSSAKIVNDTTSGSFTMPGGSITFMTKAPTDTVSTVGANVLITSVAFSTS
jgi:hypothetical protein